MEPPKDAEAWRRHDLPPRRLPSAAEGVAGGGRLVGWRGGFALTLAATSAAAAIPDARADGLHGSMRNDAHAAVLPPQEWKPSQPPTRVPAVTPDRRAREREHRSIKSVYDGRDVVGLLDLRSAAVGQLGRDFVVRLRTEGSWTAAALAEHPGRKLCLDVWRGAVVSDRPQLQLCLGGRRSAGQASLRARVLDVAGRAAPGAGRSAAITRPDARTVRLQIPAETIGLRVGRFLWRARTTWTSDDGRCVLLADGSDPCLDLASNDGVVGARIVPVRALRCLARGPRFVLHGPRVDKVVALTFDDGPSPYTPAILRILRRHDVPATFFVVGQVIPGHGRLLRRMLRDGHEIANHSWNHANLARGGFHSSRQLAATTSAIERRTRFEPCAFRAPYGAVGSDLIARARRLGMTTIGWDVDTRDWTLPGSASIARRAITGVRRGSIVLMHDGGGPRSQTVGALATTIRALRARGYRFVTVADLLGLKLVYGRVRS